MKMAIADLIHINLAIFLQSQDLALTVAFQARKDFPLGSFEGYCCTKNQWEKQKERLEAKSVF